MSDNVILLKIDLETTFSLNKHKTCQFQILLFTGERKKIFLI